MDFLAARKTEVTVPERGMEESGQMRKSCHNVSCDLDFPGRSRSGGIRPAPAPEAVVT
jgi:hypothetical protein